MFSSRFSDKAHAWLPLLPLLLLLAGTWWLSLQVQPLPQAVVQQRHDIDYAIDKLTIVSLGADGRPQHRIAADRLWHYPDDDTTHLLMPQIATLHESRTPLSISARTGMLSRKGDEIFLYDEVRLQRRSDARGEQLFTTDYLHMVPDLDWADSDQAVVLKDARGTLRAVGMELDNRAQTVKLLSRVRADYAAVD